MQFGLSLIQVGEDVVDVIVDDDDTDAVMDMLLAKKRSSDRRAWLEASGDLADPQ